MTGGINLNLFATMIQRRGWIALVLFSVVFTACASLIIPLPNIYTAKALILVEGQQVPTDFVRSTVTMGVERRLQVISQEILSRSRLEELVGQFALYPDLQKQGESGEVVAATMRRDVGIRIQGKRSGLGTDTVAFEISYTSTDPQKAMQVANTLASSYIEENLKVRGQVSLGTTTFLQNELDTAKERLEEQEQQMAAYRQQYFGELPEQLSPNLSTLTLLQKQMEVLSLSLVEAQERRSFVRMRTLPQFKSDQLAALERSEASLANVEALRDSLANLQARFSEKHPDVLRLKQTIATMEGRLEDKKSAPLAQADPEEIAVNAEIRRLKSELERVHRDIAIYQQRIENTPKREQELLSISRDYETTSNQYSSLLKRLGEANLADSLEQRQKAERFRLLEQALYPTKPAAPNRGLLIMIALALSLGLAALGILLGEMFDTSFHRVEDLKAFITTPVLVTIPRIVTVQDKTNSRRTQILGATALAISLILVIGASYRIAAGNERLARAFVGPAVGAQLRQ